MPIDLFQRPDGGLRRPLDIDAPAGQLRREAGILSGPPDSQRELLIQHDDGGGAHALAALVHHDTEHVVHTERIGDEGGGIIAPLHDIDALPVQLP